MTKHPCYQIRMYQKHISYISSLIAKKDTTTKKIIVLRPDIFAPRQNLSRGTSHLEPLGIMSQQILRVYPRFFQAQIFKKPFNFRAPKIFVWPTKSQKLQLHPQLSRKKSRKFHTKQDPKQDCCFKSQFTKFSHPVMCSFLVGGFNPSENITVAKLDHFPKVRDEIHKNIWVATT